jgi:hypothetical protein
MVRIFFVSAAVSASFISSIFYDCYITMEADVSFLSVVLMFSFELVFFFADGSMFCQEAVQQSCGKYL